MVIISCFFVALLLTCTIMGTYEVVSNKVRTTRASKEYANLPKKVLLTYALRNSAYNGLYHDMRQVMSDDRAASHVIKRMLTDRKILKYRREKL